MAPGGASRYSRSNSSRKACGRRRSDHHHVVPDTSRCVSSRLVHVMGVLYQLSAVAQVANPSEGTCFHFFPTSIHRNLV
ncbi:hypothetical protein GQ53DRAFT_302775 [Thozetella sp. PMI_491]|nr:hypothetical protein GQ53DRAFT_302775 [Thozetella sp. PMI_491]